MQEGKGVGGEGVGVGEGGDGRIGQEVFECPPEGGMSGGGKLFGFVGFNLG